MSTQFRTTTNSLHIKIMSQWHEYDMFTVSEEGKVEVEGVAYTPKVDIFGNVYLREGVYLDVIVLRLFKGLEGREGEYVIHKNLCKMDCSISNLAYVNVHSGLYDMRGSRTLCMKRERWMFSDVMNAYISDSGRVCDTPTSTPITPRVNEYGRRIITRSRKRFDVLEEVDKIITSATRV